MATNSLKNTISILGDLVGFKNLGGQSNLPIADEFIEIDQLQQCLDFLKQLVAYSRH